MEEHFDQILIENNKRRNGAILRFDEKWDWISAHQFQKFPELDQHQGKLVLIQVFENQFLQNLNNSLKAQFLDFYSI